MILDVKFTEVDESIPTDFGAVMVAGEGGTTPIEVDSALSETSENPVQNKVVTAAFLELQEQANAAFQQINSDVQDISEKVLPEVTTADNDKIMKVENGVWVPADAPEGGSVTVDSEFSETSENPVQNKVITAAMSEAATVLGELQAGLEQGEQAIQYLAEKSLPDVTTDDNDKFLRVVDGKWAAVAMPTAESESF